VEKEKLVFYDEWLAKILKKDVYRLSISDKLLGEGGNWNQTLKENYLLLKSVQRGPVFIYARVPTNSAKATGFLEEAGFRMCESEYIFHYHRF